MNKMTKKYIYNVFKTYLKTVTKTMFENIFTTITLIKITLESLKSKNLCIYKQILYIYIYRIYIMIIYSLFL